MSLRAVMIMAVMVDHAARYPEQAPKVLALIGEAKAIVAARQAVLEASRLVGPSVYMR